LEQKELGSKESKIEEEEEEEFIPSEMPPIFDDISVQTEFEKELDDNLDEEFLGPSEPPPPFEEELPSDAPPTFEEELPSEAPPKFDEPTDAPPKVEEKPKIDDTPIYWKEAIDSKDGKSYYYNILTKQTTWNKPDRYIPTQSKTNKMKELFATTTTTSNVEEKPIKPKTVVKIKTGPALSPLEMAQAMNKELAKKKDPNANVEEVEPKSKKHQNPKQSI